VITSGWSQPTLLFLSSQRKRSKTKKSTNINYELDQLEEGTESNDYDDVDDSTIVDQNFNRTDGYGYLGRHVSGRKESRNPRRCRHESGI
jgi:hypothetical protein